MSSPETESVEEIRQDIACPQCEYNLRGLRGDVVQCPECGMNCDVVELIERRWTKPWWTAPGFNRLVVPVVVATIDPMLLSVLMVARQGSVMIVPLAGTVVLFGWLYLMFRIGLRGGTEAVLLSLLAHLIFVGYVIGVYGCIAMIIRMVGMVLNQMLSLQLLGAAVVAGLLVALVWGCRRGERFIAGRCIRRYLAAAPSF